MPQASLERVARGLLPAARLARFAGTPRGALRVEALDAHGAALAAVEVVAERDGLDVPAAPPLWAARALRGTSRSGVLRLADLVTPDEALAGLRALGCAVTETGIAQPPKP